MNRRRWISLIVVIAVGIAAWWGFAQANRPQHDAQADTQADTAIDDAIVSASATLAPQRYAVLAFRSGGRVQSLAPAAGQVVAAGDALVQLTDADVRAALAQAEAGLSLAQANLARLKAGARPEQIAQAQAGLAVAEAGLARTRAGARPEELSQAQAALNAAQARLSQARSGVRPEQAAIAQAQVRQAETALAAAQDAYDRMRWVGGETERGLIAQRDAAGAALATAQAQLAALQAPAQTDDIAVAKALETQAQAQLDALKAGATVHEIAAAQAGVAQAQAALALAKAGATPEELAAAQAQLDAAKAVRDQAQAMLAETTLRAPFAATVTSVTIRPGEIAAPAQPVVTLADLTTLRLETDDLSETRITSVHVGQPVSIIFEALPERTLRGTVTHIAPMSSLKQGGTNYAATIALDTLDAALRWGMTARVEIDTTGVDK